MPMPKQTHTVVTMEVSHATWLEIEAKLHAAGYEHTFDEDGAIDMTGIALVASTDVPKVDESDINRWQALIQQCPAGPWVMGNGGSFDRTTINPISDDMLEELAQWLRMGYTPWNGRSMPLSPSDRQFMFLLYYSVQGLIARMRAAEKLALPEAGITAVRPR